MARDDRRLSRETRLLLLTLAVSVAMLLVLARFRFPEERGVPTLTDRVPAAPLERLAARATYDELASIIGELERRIAPALVVLRVEPGGYRASAGRRGAGEQVPRWVPGVRVRPDAVLAMVELGASVMRIAGSDDTPVVEAYDPLRNLAIVRVPPIADTPPGIWEAARPQTLSGRYVAVVEGTLGGPTLRPTFLGRADPIGDARWEGPLLVLGGALQAPPGSLVFSLDARLVGMSVLEDGSLAIVPAQALLDVVDQLSASTPPPLGDFGVEVQPLTPTIAAATGTSMGVVVTHVEEGGPSDGRLRFGDVIQTVDGQQALTPRVFRILEGRAPPGVEVLLGIVREGEPLEVPITTPGVTDPVEPAQEARLGLVLESRAGVGCEVISVEDESAAARAGLVQGDLITQIGQQSRPSPAQVRRAWAGAAPGVWLLVGLSRDDQRLVVALEKR